MVAIVFPGQGSQKPGMGRALYESRPEAREVFGQVSEATGVDLGRLCFESDEETLRETQNAQLALYTCGVAAWACLYAHLRGVLEPQAFAGHSIGEYAALAASGSVAIADGARLVQRRGASMADAGAQTPGTMAAVLGLDRETLANLCAVAPGVVVVANDNCPGQLVISGEPEAVRVAGESALGAGAKRVLPLNVSGAFHSPLMDEAARSMRSALEAAPFRLSGRVYANVTAQPVVTAGRWPELLEQQLRAPVRWTETMQNMANEGIDAFVECGVGDVLGNLVKRTVPEATRLKVNDLDSLEATIAAIRR